MRRYLGHLLQGHQWPGFMGDAQAAVPTHDIDHTKGVYWLGSDGGSPKKGRTLFSNRVIALIRSPVSVST